MFGAPRGSQVQLEEWRKFTQVAQVESALKGGKKLGKIWETIATAQRSWEKNIVLSDGG